MPKCLDCDKIVSPAHAAIHPGHRVVALSQNPKTRARIESQISNQVAYSKLPEELKKSQRAKAEARYRVKNGVPRKSFADMLRKSDAEQYLQNGSKQSHHVEGEPTSVASMRISVTPPGVHGDVGKKLDAGDWKVMFIVLGGTAALTAAGILVSQARDWINGLFDQRDQQRDQQNYSPGNMTVLDGENVRRYLNEQNALNDLSEEGEWPR